MNITDEMRTVKALGWKPVDGERVLAPFKWKSGSEGMDYATGVVSDIQSHGEGGVCVVAFDTPYYAAVVKSGQAYFLSELYPLLEGTNEYPR